MRIGIHRHLTIRSSRPHVVASATCYALRLHASAAPPRVGLTQALGGMVELTAMDMDEHLINRQEMYFGTSGATPEKIAASIASDALILGCTSVHVWNCDGWWLIAGDLDWLNAPNRSKFTDLNAFEAPWALPEAGQFQHLSAVMARAFAVATATRCGENLRLVKGTSDDLQQFIRVSVDAPQCNRVIGFRFQTAA